MPGLAGAGGAIVSGWADWSDAYEDPRTLGMAHAMVNGVAVTGYLLSLALRRSGRRRAGLLTPLIACLPAVNCRQLNRMDGCGKHRAARTVLDARDAAVMD
jgi:hypothetical protein